MSVPFIPSSSLDNEIDFKIEECLIQGKMIHGVCTIPGDLISSFSTKNFKEEIKYSLMQQLAKYMLEKNLVEFTKQDDYVSGETTIHIRAFLTPDSQVRILRTMKK